MPMFFWVSRRDHLTQPDKVVEVGGSEEIPAGGNFIWTSLSLSLSILID